MALPLDNSAAGPGKAFAADADAVTDRLTALAHQIEELVLGIDNDGAGLFAGRVLHDLTQIALVHPLDRNGGQLIAVILARRIHGFIGAKGRIDIRLRCERLAIVVNLDNRHIRDCGASGEADGRCCGQCSQETAAGNHVLHH